MWKTWALTVQIFCVKHLISQQCANFNSSRVKEKQFWLLKNLKRAHHQRTHEQSCVSISPICMSQIIAKMTHHESFLWPIKEKLGQMENFQDQLALDKTVITDSKKWDKYFKYKWLNSTFIDLNLRQMKLSSSKPDPSSNDKSENHFHVQWTTNCWHTTHNAESFKLMSGHHCCFGML